jgi:hypothetical protein
LRCTRHAASQAETAERVITQNGLTRANHIQPKNSLKETDKRKERKTLLAGGQDTDLARSIPVPFAQNSPAGRSQKELLVCLT